MIDIEGCIASNSKGDVSAERMDIEQPSWPSSHVTSQLVQLYALDPLQTCAGGQTKTETAQRPSTQTAPWRSIGRNPLSSTNLER